MFLFNLKVYPRVIVKIKVGEMSPVQLGQIGGVVKNGARTIGAVADDQRRGQSVFTRQHRALINHNAVVTEILSQKSQMLGVIRYVAQKFSLGSQLCQHRARVGSISTSSVIQIRYSVC